MANHSVHFLLRLGALCVLALGGAARAQSGSSVTNEGSPSTRFDWYTDFASTTILGHRSDPTDTFGGSSGLKYTPLTLRQQSGVHDDACFEVVTAHPDFIPGDIADTRIWYLNFNTDKTESLNDDSGGGLFSRARVFLSGYNSFVSLKIAAYSSYWNKAHFKIIVTRLPLSESACTSGQATIAWVKVIDGVMTSQPR